MATIPGSGAITFSALQSEFGGSNPIALTEYYSGSLPIIGGSVPSSGALAVGNFRDSHAAKGLWGNGTNSMNALNFITETASTIAIVGLLQRNGVNSSTKLYGISTSSTTSVTSVNFVTETFTSLTVGANPSPSSGGVGTACNSSTAGYAYFDQQNANSVPTLPTNKTNVVKFTFSSETFSAGGSTTGVQFANYGSSQSSTKGYLGGYAYWTGDLFNPVDNVVNSIMGLTFSSDTASSIGKTLPGTTRWATSQGNSLLKSYFYGGSTGVQGGTLQNTITAMPFSTETPVNLSATLVSAYANQGGVPVCSGTKNWLNNQTLTYATETITSLGSTVNPTQNCGQPYSIMP